MGLERGPAGGRPEQRSGADAYDITYTYDPVGNRLTKERGGTVTTYSYDLANQTEYEETPSARTTFTFDSNGNLAVQQAGSQRTTYSWDLENMCSHIVVPSGGRSTFMYDGDLRRRFASEASSWPRAFVLDGDNVIMELDLGGSVTKAYTVEPAGYGNLISEWYSSMSRSYWFHFDALGTTERITGPSQSVVTTFVNSAFGVPEAVGGPYPSSPPPFRWLGRIGYWWEPDASQYDVRRRRYDPQRGRWVSYDPEHLDHDRYLYASNDPMGRVDPSGMWELSVRGYRILVTADLAYRVARGVTEARAAYLRSVVDTDATRIWSDKYELAGTQRVARVCVMPIVVSVRWHRSSSPFGRVTIRKGVGPWDWYTFYEGGTPVGGPGNFLHVPAHEIGHHIGVNWEESRGVWKHGKWVVENWPGFENDSVMGVGVWSVHARTYERHYYAIRDRFNAQHAVKWRLREI